MQPSLWLVPEPHAVAWREWDDEFVAYNDTTGSTHHLSALGGHVLLALLAHPSGMDATALAHAIATRVEMPADAQLAAEVQQTLAQLTELGLAASRVA